MKDWTYYWNKRWMYYVLGKLRSRHSFCYDWLKNDAKSAIHQILRWYSEFKYSRKQTFCQRRYTKNAIFHHSDKIMALNCWGTRTRTRKDRTRICSVANYTIPQTSFASRFPLDYGCKVTRFFITSQAKTGKLYDCRHEYQKNPFYLRWPVKDKAFFLFRLTKIYA